MCTNSADYGHGGAYVRKREVRALAHVCSPMALIAALLAVLLVPTIALADSSVIWGPSDIPNAENGIVVNAPDKYRAAAVALGYSDADISSWSADVLAKLSNQSTGGDFYQFAQLFGEVDDAVGDDNPLTAVVSAVGNAFWAIAETLYGDDIWLAGYSSEMAAGAASDLSSILAGENIGGGGGSSGPATEFPHSLTLSNYVGDVQQITIQFTDYAVGQANQLLVDYPYYQVAVCQRYSSFWFSVLFSNQPFETHSSVADTEGGRNLYRISSVFNVDSSYRYGSVQNSFTKNGNVWTGNVSSLPRLTTASATAGTDTVRTGEYPKDGGYYNSSASSTPVVPPSNWPEQPSAPSPPDLPEPGTNPTVNPTPWSPVLSPSFDFDLNITTDPTSSELIDWVQKIYYELKAFHSDAHDWAEDFGGGFTKVVQAVNSASSQLYSQLLVMDSSIHDEGLKIRNYMYQMFHWLKEQLNFQNDSFNDNNIVYWLKRIWSKLGSGDINLRPTDPTTEPDDWWDWLVKAVQNFLIGLAATSTELISEIADLASQVMHEFPFSIPWDIAAVLAALSTAPITPVFTITVPAVSGWWASFDFVIDMSPFDGAAETIRLMEKLLFTGLLIWKSKDLLDFMDVTKWFN